ncbi:MAG: NAD(+) synthase [Cyanobacteria bacterium P01_H01_bin.74]
MPETFSQQALLAIQDQLRDHCFTNHTPKTAANLSWFKQQAETYGLQHGQGLHLLGQINPSPGCLSQNAKKISALIQAGQALSVDLVVFPELALMGYSPRDIIGRFPFLVDENLKWLKALAQQTQTTQALVGFVDKNTSGTGKLFYNSVALLGHGQILKIFHKTLLPNYHEFEDSRQFESAGSLAKTRPEPNTFALYNTTYGVIICEDMWETVSPMGQPLYHTGPLTAILAQQPDILINCSASPSRQGKLARRHALCHAVAEQARVPLIYVNQVGTIDEITCDGDSGIYLPDGRQLCSGASFSEDAVLTQLPSKPAKGLAAGEKSSDSSTVGPTVFNAFNSFNAFKQKTTITRFSNFMETVQDDLPRTYAVLTQGIRDYFQKTGFQKALLGLSGGLDSSVTAVLLVDALGADNVLGVMMPTAITPQENQDDASQLAENLGLVTTTCPIGSIIAGFHTATPAVIQSINQTAGNWQTAQAQNQSNADENIQAITRATVLRQLGNTYNALPIATSDKSEFYLGYATVNGDMSGALAPLGDVTKTRARALAHWMNANRDAKNAIPERCISKPPGADLKQDPETGKVVTAESELMPYPFADEIIWRTTCLKQSYTTLLEMQLDYENAHSLSRAQKQDWLDKFFKRLSSAAFKWFIAPPILIVDETGSLAKSAYHHPITSNQIAWQGHSETEIFETLNSGNTIKGN